MERPVPLFFLICLALGGVVACELDELPASFRTDSMDGEDGGNLFWGDAEATAAWDSELDAGIRPRSPLCRRKVETCDLDEEQGCAGSKGDGGGSSSSRCSLLGDRSVCERAGINRDGQPCTGDTDCAAGFTCVQGLESRLGVCRRSCCAGSCASVSVPSSRYYCSLSTTIDQIPVPVCVPARSCRLLEREEGGCVQGETCAPVLQGVSACVPVGNAVEGDACDTVHCGEHLACLGVVGAKKCKRICHTSKFPCETGKLCVGGYPFFEEEGYGVCSSP